MTDTERLDYVLLKLADDLNIDACNGDKYEEYLESARLAIDEELAAIAQERD